MKKPADDRFERELVHALRSQMRDPARNAGRLRVAHRLQTTLAHLGVGAASAVPIILDAQTAAASHAAGGSGGLTQVVAPGASTAGASAAAASAAAAAGAHPIAAILTAFALGAGVGGASLALLVQGQAVSQSAASASVLHSRAPSQRTSTAPPLPGPRPAPSAASFPLEPAPFLADAPDDRARRGPWKSLSAPGAAAPISQLPASAVQSDGAEAGETPRESLAAQQALLAQARASLAQGDAERALVALSEHGRVHPASALGEERQALIIKSLIARAEYARARSFAADFAVRYPRSLFLPSIRSALSRNP